jgi:hypothetical protein
VAFAAKGYEIGKIIRPAYGPWNDMVNVKTLSQCAKFSLKDTTPLASVIVPLPCCGSSVFPIISAPIMLGCSALPRRVFAAFNIGMLPTRITNSGTKYRLIRAERAEMFFALLAFYSQQVMAALPASLRAIFRIAAWIYFKFTTANDTRSNNTNSLCPSIVAPCIPANFRTKPLNFLVSFKLDMTNFAMLFHRFIIAQKASQ